MVRGQMRGREGSRDGAPAFICRRELGLGCTSSSTIGYRGRRIGAAL
jgi:hypothetical protein